MSGGFRLCEFRWISFFFLFSFFFFLFSLFSFFLYLSLFFSCLFLFFYFKTKNTSSVRGVITCHFLSSLNAASRLLSPLSVYVAVCSLNFYLFIFFFLSIFFSIVNFSFYHSGITQLPPLCRFLFSTSTLY